MTTMELLTILTAPVSALALAGFAVFLQKMSRPPRERGAPVETAETKLATQDERAAKIEANLKGLRREIEEIRGDSVFVYSTKINVKAKPYRLYALRAAHRRGARSVKAVEEATKAIHQVFGTVPR